MPGYKAEWLLSSESHKPSFTSSVILELFCGTAGVSASLKWKGFANSRSVCAQTLQSFRSEARSPQLRLPEVAGVFMSPPSATRNIEVPGVASPRPLRSPEQADDVGNLEGADLLRIRRATALYDFCAEVADLCVSLGKLFMLVNPKNSLFWEATPWKERRFSHLDCVQDHQACAYGSSRPTNTRLVANFTQVHTICAMEPCPQPMWLAPSQCRRVTTPKACAMPSRMHLFWPWFPKD